MKHNFDIQEFRKKFYNKFPKSNIEILDYDKNNQFIILKDEYGICKMNKHNLLKGFLPSIRCSINKINYLKNQILHKFPLSKNIYEIISYKNQNNIIVKTKYGLHKANSSALLKGVVPSINSCINKNEYFINKSIEKFQNKFNYTILNYKNAKTAIKLICNICKIEFKTIPSHHFDNNSKGGCPNCAYLAMQENNKNYPPGWNKNNWFKSAQKSKHFDSFKVYIIECWNENERFYKIGRTFKKINRRFCSFKHFKYNYKIIKIIEFKENNKYYSDMIYDLENNLKKINKKYKYIPLNDFDGMHECFSQIVDNNRDIYLVKREEIKKEQIF